ncbi:hypothetical protein HJ526_04480 [Donghicola sp. C2-DW-16]|uniref:Polysaccharide chain length determinant N-terminal domain-containing protein n=1 Tax=Donghicola mangrovi TaxID=2729614 RepID=A0ABX2PB29_9RHOB|nr:hypothetical protein [Donghicola mangrovi]NVO26668.1 hypothetical protein [Donghicola mangrovi]
MLDHYRDLLRFYKRIIIVSMICAASLAWMGSTVLLNTSPAYKSTVTMNMQPSEEELAFNRTFMGVSQFNPATIITQTHIEVLLSRPVAERTLDLLLAQADGEQALPEPGLFDAIKGFLWRTYVRLNYGTFKEVDERTQLVNLVHDSIEVEFVEGSYILNLTAQSEFPTLAARIANAYAQAYVDLTRQEFSSGAGKLADLVRKLKVEREGELRDLLVERERVREELNINDLWQEADVLLLSRSATQQDIDDDVIELQLRKNELAKLKEQLDGGRASQPVARVEEEIRQREARLDLRRQALARTDKQLSEQAEKERSLKQLEARYEAVQLDLDELRDRLVNLEMSEATILSQIQVINPATPALYPSFPKVLVNTVIATIVGALAVIMPVILIDVVGMRVRTYSDLQSILGGHALPSARKGMERPGLARWRTGRMSGLSREFRNFSEQFGRRMSTEDHWTKEHIFVTGFLPYEEIKRLRDVVAMAVEHSNPRRNGDAPYVITAIAPVASVQDWDELPDGPIILGVPPAQVDALEIRELQTVGQDNPRKPFMLIWN